MNAALHRETADRPRLPPERTCRDCRPRRSSTHHEMLSNHLAGIVQTARICFHNKPSSECRITTDQASAMIEDIQPVEKRPRSEACRDLIPVGVCFPERRTPHGDPRRSARPAVFCSGRRSNRHSILDPLFNRFAPSETHHRRPSQPAIQRLDAFPLESVEHTWRWCGTAHSPKHRNRKLPVDSAQTTAFADQNRGTKPKSN